MNCEGREVSKDLTSIGFLALDLRASVRDIERAADRLGIEPSLVLNRVAHFDATQAARIAEALNAVARRPGRGCIKSRVES